MAESVDIAIISAKSEEYQAVYDVLQNPQLWPGSLKKPRRYSWTLGTIRQRNTNARYRVVLAVTHEQTNVSAALAAKATIDTFSSRYVVFVGIGGSLQDWISQGDLVVGNYMWGYEYGRMDETGNFVPRHLFTEALDNTLKTSAATFTQMQPDWWKTVGAKPGTADTPPKVEFGGIASGDKVLESIEPGFCQAILKADPDLYAVDMEGHGTAQAVRQIREERPIGLMVVRGITDVPIGVTRSQTQQTAQTSGQIARRDWTQYASRAASAFLCAFISSGFPFAANETTSGAQQTKSVSVLASRGALLPPVVLPRIGENATNVPPPQPMVQRSWETPGGTVDVESRFYVVRSVDTIAQEALRQQGKTLIIKGARQMGKSSLLLRVLRQEETIGKQPAPLDFSLLDHSTIATGERFFQEFCRLMSDALGIEDRVEDYWDSARAVLPRCTRYVKEHVLPSVSKPIVLAIDESESIIETTFRDEFFKLLRHWHNQRATGGLWKQLDIVIVTSTEPYLLIANPHHSPFNVGETIELEDFTHEQVITLNHLHGSPLNSDEEVRLMLLLHGHPYLVRQSLYLIVTQRVGVEELFTTAASDNGPFKEHLHYHLARLKMNQSLMHAMQKVIHGHSRPDDDALFRLQSAGLVLRNAESAMPRCQLYADYFGRHLP